MPSEKSADDTVRIPRLKFADKHIEPILKGQKTLTIRRDIEPGEFDIGHRIHLCDSEGERFASAIIDDRGYTSINMAAKMVFDGHRSYRDGEELLAELESYYPEQDLDLNSHVELIYWDWEDLWE